MPDPVPPPKLRLRGNRRKHFGPWERCELKMRALWGALLTAFIFIADVIQTQDLKAVLMSHGTTYLTCYAATVGLQATILKYRDNSGKLG